ncbi:hypothetical protein DRE_05115 [Drechslerella stenobrocha 248]|uniref:HECT-type E3 ubiquitin transferase n=1 Tax=Drechslerella stenobrocha 248 TaxID=1043628 RepID=W7I0M9_9PEZI|nr:hypothetical protein DRE_05115 [Drechslerella stenobrocha 248]
MLNFTGNTRRKRQVNLSGKPTSAPSQSVIAAARESRAQRESERQKNAAAIRIQSAFRAYRSRKLCCSSWRVAWDKSVGFSPLSRGESSPLGADALAHLLLFYTPTDPTDLERLFFVIAALHPDDPGNTTIDIALQSGGRILSLLKRLSQKTVLTLSKLSATLTDTSTRTQILLYLFYISRVAAHLPQLADASYFAVLRSIIQHGFLQYAVQQNTTSRAPTDARAALAVLQAIVLPLQSTESTIKSSVYSHFAQDFLSTPYLNLSLFPIISVAVFRKLLDLRNLMQAASTIQLNSPEQDGAPWLLSSLISLGLSPDLALSSADLALEQAITSHPLYQPANVDDSPNSTASFGPFVTAVSRILDAYSADAARPTSSAIELPSSRSSHNNRMNGKGDANESDSLPIFIQEQLDQLLGTRFVQYLADLVLADPRSPAASQDLQYARNAAQSLSLHLLVSFRFLRQKLHNRLFLARSSDGISLLPALFSQVQRTQQFQSGLTGTRDILNGLKARSSSAEWTAIFLFLDVYSFGNVVMDDEEFFSFQDKALSPGQLRLLVAFLKNLAFTTYFEVSEIESDSSQEGSRFTASITADRIRTETRSNVGGVNGVSLPWIRSLIVRILRSLHRRDSRNPFLPTGFWLMKEVNVENSTSLIAEEEARQQNLEDMNEAEDSDSDEEYDFQPASAGRHGSSSKKQEKAIRHNYLASITPRLEVLQNLPFFIPFKTRVSIFRDFVRLDQIARGTTDPELWRLSNMSHPLEHQGRKAKHHGVIRRERVFEDAYDEFFPLGEGFKEPIQITFVDSFGAEEAGIDGGGILKEFLSSIVQESYRKDPTHGVPFFAETEDHLLYPNPSLVDQVSWGLRQQSMLDYQDSQALVSHEIMELLKRFEFLGRIIGKCMYEGILVDVRFADFFLLKWSKVLVGNGDVGLGVDDLKSFDYSLWKGLQALKRYDDRTIRDLDLTFTAENVFRFEDPLSPSGSSQKAMTVDLKPNGSQISVTSSNRLEYIHLLSRYKLITQGKAQTSAFLKGLSSVIAPRWLSMFNQSELQTLVGGNESPLDIEDLRKNTIYGGVYVLGDDHKEHPTIAMFWRVMKRLKEDDKRAVLKFVTSVSRAPLLGFGSLNPRFSIRDAGNDSTRLPSTSTCVNLLKLPRYESEGALEEKLLYAANAGAGFDLS